MSRTKLYIALSLSLVFVSGLVYFVDGSHVLDSLDQLTLPTLAAALAGLLLTYMLRALRVFYEFKPFNGPAYGVALRVILFHNAALNVMPFRSGEITFPWLLKRYSNIALTQASVSLLWLRLQDACIVALIALWLLPTLAVWAQLSLSVVWLCAVWGLTWFARTTQHAHPVFQALRHTSRHVGMSWGITLTNWVIKLGVQAFLFAQLLHASVWVGGLGALGSEFAGMMPIQGVAGIGSFEAVGAAGLSTQSVPWLSGLQAAACVHAVILTSALTWAGVAWLVSAAHTHLGFTRDTKGF